MKSLTIAAALLATLFIVKVNGEDPVIIKLLEPSGFILGITDPDPLTGIEVHVSINEELSTTADGQSHGQAESLSNGKWLYEETRVNVNPNDTIYYRLDKSQPGVKFEKKVERYHVPHDADREDLKGRIRE